MNAQILRYAACTLCLVVLVFTSVRAQDDATGTVSGLVTDSQTDDPLPGVNVILEGTTTGASTGPAGRYQFTAPAGEYTLVASFIGYGIAEVSITITAGETTEQDIGLEPDELSLDEVVVTSPGGLPVSKRRLGNSIGVVRAADVENLAVPDVTRLLESRTSGVQVLNSSGSPGTASLVQIRGISSLTGDTTPLIYVDGVRVTSVNSFKNGTIDDQGGQAVTTLNLINPADIERVEVLKGASAAVLYGSDAANGVLQIYTKSGGSIGTEKPLQLSYSPALIAHDWSLYNDKIPNAAQDFLNSQSGLGTVQQLSVSGSGENYQFYSGGTYRREGTGIQGSNEDFLSARANYTYAPDEKTKIRVGTGYVANLITRPDANNRGTSTSGWYSNLLKPNEFNYGERVENSFSGRTLYEPSVFDKVHNTYENRRYSGNLGVNRVLTDNFTIDGNIGYEDLVLEQVRWVEQGHATNFDGSRDKETTNVSAINAALSLNWTQALADGIEVATAVGTEYYRNNREFLNVGNGSFQVGLDRVVQFGDPDSRGLSERSSTFASGALYGQSQFSLYDRAFVTLGLRADRSSSFGAEAGARFYPKVSVSYLLPVEEALPFISTAKIRGSFGQAGLQPDPGASDLTLDPELGFVDFPSVLVERPGNDELKPSRTTEYEIGTDLSFLQNRLGTEFTFYYQQTEDDLFAVRTRPSMGFGNREQTRNVAGVRTTGIEASVFVTPVLTDAVRYTTRANFTTVNSQVTDDGGVPFSTGPFNSLQYFRVEEGRRVGTFSYRQISVNELGEVSTNEEPGFYGNVLPVFTGNWSHEMTLFKRVSLLANFGWATGFKILNFTRANMRRNGVFDTEFTQAEYEAGQAALAVPAEERSPEEIEAATNYHFNTNSRSPVFLEDGDFVKLRELALSYSLPSRLIESLRLSGLTLTGSVTNVFTLSNYSGFDSEVSVGAGDLRLRGADNRSLPPTRRFVFRASMQF